MARRDSAQYIPQTPDGQPSAFSARLFSRFRKAWLTTKSIDMVLYAGYESKQHGGDVQRFRCDPVSIQLRIYNRTIWLVLNNFTEAELEGMRRFFNTAIDMALPVVKSMDEVAQQELDRGDANVSPRSFRLAPVYVERDITPARLATLPTPDNEKEQDDLHQNGMLGEA